MRAHLLTIALFFSAQLLAIDVITMQNGDVYRGEIIHQEKDKYFQVRFSDGNEKRLRFSDVSEISHEDNEPPPRTQTNQHISRDTLITFGWVSLGISYGATAIASAFSNGTYTFIPVVGPFLQLRDPAPNYISPLIASGVMQLGSVAVLVIGYLQKDDTPKETTWNIVPVGPASSLGLSLAMKF